VLRRSVRIHKSMEQKIKIKTNDKKVIYGTLTPSTKKSDKLIIFVHGMTSSSYEPKYYNAVRFFRDHGFNSLVFEQYSGGNKGARRFIDTMTSTHVHDLNVVVHHFNNKYKKLYLVTHSWGGPVAMLADLTPIAALVLWDPSINYTLKENKYFAYDKRVDAYVTDWGVQTLVGKAWVEEARALPAPEDLGARLTKPTKIIAAKIGNSHKTKHLFKKVKVPTAYHHIDYASHNFPEWGAQEELFRETLTWLKRW